MTREELEKEAEMFVSEKADKGNFDVEKFGKAYFSESSMKQALVKFAEPREKRIADLEKENEELRNNGFTVSAMTEQQLKVALEKGEQLEKENAELKEELKNWKDEWQEQVQKAIDEGYARTQQTIQLTKAKKIIRDLLGCFFYLFKHDNKTRGHLEINNAIEQAEQFLKEIEK